MCIALECSQSTPVGMQPVWSVHVLCNPHRRDWDLETKHLSISVFGGSQLWDPYESEIQRLFIWMKWLQEVKWRVSSCLSLSSHSLSLSLCVSNFSVLMRGDIMNADAVGDALKRKVTRTLAHKRSLTLTCSYGSHRTAANTVKIIMGGWNDRHLASWYV